MDVGCIKISNKMIPKESFEMFLINIYTIDTGMFKFSISTEQV